MENEIRNYGANIAPIEKTITEGAAGTLKRTRYAIADFVELERGAALSEIFESWKSYGGRGWCPKERVHRHAELVAFVDVSNDDPLSFVMNEHRVCPNTGLGGEWHGQPLRAHKEWIPHAVQCATDYHFCKQDGHAVFHWLEQQMLGLDRNYLRLLLPVKTRGDTVDRVYYATRRLTPNRRIES